jgi:hypothetical protein
MHADGTRTGAAARLIRKGRAIVAVNDHTGLRPISVHPRASACICVRPFLACFAARRTVPPNRSPARLGTVSWQCRLPMRGVLASWVAAGMLSRGAGELVHGPLTLPVKRGSALGWFFALLERLARFMEDVQAMARAVRGGDVASIEDMVEQGRKIRRGLIELKEAA